MRIAPRRLAWTAAIAAVGTAGALAHERLRVPSNGNPLYWPSPSAISIVIQSAGSDDVPGPSEEVALRMAIADWNAVPGSDLALIEDATPAQQARTDFESDDLHLILFDESNDSGYFGGGGIVAITPVWFYQSGQIADADVIFNGSEFMFTTSKQPGRFDVGSVGAHELGHLLGLDHSGWASATMYPYVDPTVVMQRSLASDELHGARAIAPSATFGRITGAVRRAGDSTPVAGAHVVAVDADGRTRASALSDASGAFALDGLDAGDFTLYADPLDAPVSAANLGSGHVIHTDFATTFGPTVSVAAGATAAAGAIDVAPDGALALGSVFDTYPLRVIQGATVNHVVRGSGLFTDCVLSASDPDLVFSNVTWFGGSVAFQVTAAASEPSGHVDLVVTDALGAVAALPAALEVGPPDPTVAAVAPASGSASGGTALELTGTGFRPGARVVIGDRVYADGEPGGCVVVDEGTITLTTLATLPGEHDAVVIDASGVEGRLADAFLAAALPSVETVFPPAGAAAGGTAILIKGSSFAFGATVRIDGVEQAATVLDATRVSVVTTGGAADGPCLLEVENPGGGLATAAFAYVAQPDPALASATPDQGPTSGGTHVTLTGANLPANVEVIFGADPVTGLGGTPAASVTWIDADTVAVVTPPHAQGATSILARDPATGQAALLDPAFSYASSGGGGGGCFVRPLDRGPTTPGAAVQGAWWLALLFLWTLRPRRRASLQLERLARG